MTPLRGLYLGPLESESDALPLCHRAPPFTVKSCIMLKKFMLGQWVFYFSNSYLDDGVFFIIIEPPYGKTNNLHRQKQRQRSASQ